MRAAALLDAVDAQVTPTTVLLARWQRDELDLLAARLGQSRSAVMRHALALLLRLERQPAATGTVQ